MNVSQPPSLEALGEVHVTVSARLGHASVPLADVLAFASGAIVPLDCAADAPVALLVNGVAIATGDLVLTEEGVLAVEIREVSP